MLRWSAVLATIALVVSAGSGAALTPAAGPAETPAATYSADTYVDSRGCLFQRASVNGSTVWVPRLGPDRTQRCGLAPSAAPMADAADGAVNPPETAPDSGSGQVAQEAYRAAPKTPKRAAGNMRARGKAPYADAGYVQIGAFRLAANSDRAIARLLSMDLPAARAQDRIGRQRVTIVLAGPFPDAAAQGAVLAQLRAAGFADAYLP